MGVYIIIVIEDNRRRFKKIELKVFLENKII